MDAHETLARIGFVYNVKHFRRLDRLDNHARPLPARLARFHGADYGLLDEDEVHNLMPTEGLNYLLDVAIRAQSQLTAWYIGIFEGNYTPVLADTAATFPGSATESTAYAESTRQAYTIVAASGGVLTNAASPAVFTMNASKTIYGGFISSASAKSATTGKICSAAQFSSSKAVVSTDVLSITATITLTSS